MLNCFLTIWEILLEKSGGPDATDHNPNDYDIMIKLCEASSFDQKLSDEEEELTLFVANDRALFEMARAYEYEGKYHEGKIFEYLMAVFDFVGAISGDDPVAVLTHGMLYHAVQGEMSSDAIRELARTQGSMPTLLDGAEISPQESGGKIYLDDGHYNAPNARVIRPYDLKAKNGIIHTINGVLYATP
jgi:uncharacterized surface protein with fasciclin (FAS1) repeats